MTNDRYNYLMWGNHYDTPDAQLTEQEIAEGWHFCFDWDGLLVGPGMPEAESCYCGVIKNE